MTHYGAREFYERRARRLTALEENARGKSAERIARRTVEIANGLEFGIEGMFVGEGFHGVSISYVNAGDTYDSTLVRIDGSGGEWRWSSWGDELEAAEFRYSEATGEHRCSYCGEWSEFVDDGGRGLCCGSVDPDSLDSDEILDSVARTLFVNAYANAADRAEEDGSEFHGDRAGSGDDWFDVAPEEPEDAKTFARMLLNRVGELAWSKGDRTPCDADSVVRKLCADWIRHGGDSGSRFSAEELFGFRLTMQSLGHGVGLRDDTDREYRSPELPFISTDTSAEDPLGGFTVHGL